jgi:radical SAM superfamily enzyme
MIDHVFSKFLKLLRNNTETGDIIVKLDMQPLNERTLRLSVDGIDMRAFQSNIARLRRRIRLNCGDPHPAFSDPWPDNFSDHF